jgi:hypothetical protein
MRAVLITFAFGLLLAPTVFGCENTRVSVKIVGQRKVVPFRHTPFLTRSVSIKVTNKTGCSIFIKGHKVSEFVPIGISMRYDPTKKNWESTLGRARVPSYEDLGVTELDELELKPNQSFEFATRFEDSAASVKLKRVIYVSVGGSNSLPRPVESPVFFFHDTLK